MNRYAALLCAVLAAPVLNALAQPAGIMQFSGREVSGIIRTAPAVAADEKTGLVAALATESELDPSRSLMITALSVVEDGKRTFDPATKKGDPAGAWAFGTLLRELARQDGRNVDPALFLQRLLTSWTVDRPSGLEDVRPRQDIQQVLDAWKALSGPTLDVARAPFRLLAIVNRVDLRTGEPTNAGEARFVFGAMDAAGNPLQFTFIFEYGVTVQDFDGLQAWAGRWARLSTLDPGRFNAELELITRDFTTALGAIGGRPVAARLNQIRTNEIALANPWELREFNIGADGLPRPVTTKKTPQDLFATPGNPTLIRYLQQFAQQITPQGTHTVPDRFDNKAFQAGKTEAPTPSFVWNPGAPIPENTRRAFSLNTCNGCHSGETGTRFKHVDVRRAGTESQLSGFLKGIKLTPVAGAPLAEYADLERRRQDLALLISPVAQGLEAKRTPLRATH